MNTVDHRIACALAAFLVSRGDRIATDLGTLTLSPDCEGTARFTARLQSGDGRMSTYAALIVLGKID
jgi:hypothetical protein